MLGVRELVISWTDNAASNIQRARQAGFEVYIQAPAQQAAAAAELASKQVIAGIIITTGNAAQSNVESLIGNIRQLNSKLQILVLDSNGKQPLMRGQTITTRNGMLQVSSPTAQPWLDSNLALARFDQQFKPGQPPPLYSFTWDSDDAGQPAKGISAEDYCLAVAEAAAIQSDLVLNLDDTLQTALAQNQPAAWATWKKVKTCLSFASSAPSSRKPWANVGVVASDYETAFEPMNLMGRHNIPFRVLRPGTLNLRELQGFDVLAVFTAPDLQDANAIQQFARIGGTAVLVDVKGVFPWQSIAPTKTAEHALSYAIEKGKIIELAEPVGDPETFAQDIRRLIPQSDVLISAWNALTTLAIPYTRGENEGTVIELLNYAEEPLRVQIRVKGLFSAIRYQSPDSNRTQQLTPVHHDGFTEFIVPSLRIAGRVYLTGASQKTRGPQSSR
jgi:hypothetical protein